MPKTDSESKDDGCRASVNVELPDLKKQVGLDDWKGNINAFVRAILLIVGGVKGSVFDNTGCINYRCRPYGYDLPLATSCWTRCHFFMQLNLAWTLALSNLSGVSAAPAVSQVDDDAMEAPRTPVLAPALVTPPPPDRSRKEILKVSSFVSHEATTGLSEKVVRL